MGNPESKPAQQFVTGMEKSVMSVWNGVYVCSLCINFKLYNSLLNSCGSKFFVSVSEFNLSMHRVKYSFHSLHWHFLISFYAPGSGFCIEQYACADHYLQPPTKTIFCNECIVTSKRSHFLCWFFVESSFFFHTHSDKAMKYQKFHCTGQGLAKHPRVELH